MNLYFSRFRVMSKFTCCKNVFDACFSVRNASFFGDFYDSASLESARMLFHTENSRLREIFHGSLRRVEIGTKNGVFL